LTRKRPTPASEIAKLHSCVFSNSSRCEGVITFSTRSRLCCGVSGCCVIGPMRPCTLSEGGMPAVMNRSDAFLWTISLRKEVKSMLLMGCLPSRCDSLPAQRTRKSFEDLLVLRVARRLLLGDQAAPHQVEQALVERLHAVGLAGLDRRIHLRHLVLADQVTDRG